MSNKATKPSPGICARVKLVIVQLKRIKEIPTDNNALFAAFDFGVRFWSFCFWITSSLFVINFHWDIARPSWKACWLLLKKRPNCAEHSMALSCDSTDSVPCSVSCSQVATVRKLQERCDTLVVWQCLGHVAKELLAKAQQETGADQALTQLWNGRRCSCAATHSAAEKTVCSGIHWCSDLLHACTVSGFVCYVPFCGNCGLRDSQGSQGWEVHVLNRFCLSLQDLCKGSCWSIKNDRFQPSKEHHGSSIYHQPGNNRLKDVLVNFRHMGLHRYTYLNIYTYIRIELRAFIYAHISVHTDVHVNTYSQSNVNVDRYIDI